MKMKHFCMFLGACIFLQASWVSAEVAPAMPDLQLPVETEAAAPVAEEPEVNAAKAQAPVKSSAKQPASIKKQAVAKAPVNTKSVPAAATQAKAAVPPVTEAAAKVNAEEIVVEDLIDTQKVQPAVPAVEEAAPGSAMPAVEGKPLQNEPNTAAAAPQKESLVVYNPPTDRDPTLSSDDTLLLKHREEERLRALEAERRRKAEEERRRLAELERQRQLELDRLRNPAREVRGKIRVSGIIGQEVFIGNKIYSVGQSVLGARILSVQPDSVVFIYKGQKFTKNVELK